METGTLGSPLAARSQSAINLVVEEAANCWRAVKSGERMRRNTEKPSQERAKSFRELKKPVTREL